jgi:phage terminase large subunit-like protein
VWGPPEQELYDALTSGSIARKQPLVIIITTAGVDEHTLCGREYEYACKVRDGLVEDASYLPMIYELPKDADWADESLWHLANPTLGEIVRIEALREECAKAKNQPSEQTKWRRLNMNQWVNAASTWIPRTEWDACSWNGSSPIPAMGASI